MTHEGFEVSRWKGAPTERSSVSFRSSLRSRLSDPECERSRTVARGIRQLLRTHLTDDLGVRTPGGPVPVVVVDSFGAGQTAVCVDLGER